MKVWNCSTVLKPKSIYVSYTVLETSLKYNALFQLLTLLFLPVIFSILVKEKVFSSYYKPASSLAIESKYTSRTRSPISFSCLLQSELLDRLSLGRGLEVQRKILQCSHFLCSTSKILSIGCQFCGMDESPAAVESIKASSCFSSYTGRKKQS